MFSTYIKEIEPKPSATEWGAKVIRVTEYVLEIMIVTLRKSIFGFNAKKNHNPKLTEDLPLPSAKVSSTPLGEAVFAEYISK